MSLMLFVSIFSKNYSDSEHERANQERRHLCCPVGNKPRHGCNQFAFLLDLATLCAEYLMAIVGLMSSQDITRREWSTKRFSRQRKLGTKFAPNQTDNLSESDRAMLSCNHYAEAVHSAPGSHTIHSLTKATDASQKPAVELGYIYPVSLN